MADGQVVFDTALDATGLNDGLDGIGKTASKSLISAGKIIAVGTAAALAGATKAAISVGSSFDTAMSQVAATMGTTVDKIGDLSVVAKKMGAETQFTATQAAQALNYLALAGYNAAQQEAALPVVLSLAAAGAMDLATASDMVTDAMGALGMEATQTNLETFGDQLAKTASKANTSVSQLGEAILTVGGTANVLSGGTTEMNTALGLLANVGLKGAEGGTHLRNVILSLSAPTKTAAKELKKLGVETVDADGNMRDMNSIMMDLGSSLDGMGTAERAATLEKIFNKTDLTAVNGLLSQCGDSWVALAAEINNSSGAMAGMAQTQLDNLQGDVTIFQSAAEGLGIAFYEGFSGKAREIVQFGTGLVGELSDGMKSGGFEGLAESLGGVLSKAIGKISADLPAMVKGFSNVFTSLFAGLGKNSGAIAKGLAGAVSSAISGLGKNLPVLVKSLTTVAGELVNGLAGELPTMISGLIEGAVSAAVGLITDIPGLLETGFNIAKSIVSGVAKGVAEIPETLMEISTATLPVNEAAVKIQSVTFSTDSETDAMIQDGVQAGIDAATAEHEYTIKVQNAWIDYSELQNGALENGNVSKKEGNQLVKWVESQISPDIEAAEEYIAEQTDRLSKLGAGVATAAADGYNSTDAYISTTGTFKIQGLVDELRATQAEYNELVKTLSQPNYTASAEEIARMEQLIGKTKELQAEIQTAMDSAVNYQKGAKTAVLAGAGTANLYGTALGYEKTVAQQKRDANLAEYEATIQAIETAGITGESAKIAAENAKAALDASNALVDAGYTSEVIALVDGMVKADPEIARNYEKFWKTAENAAQAQTAATNMNAIEDTRAYFEKYGDYVKELLSTDWFEDSGVAEKMGLGRLISQLLSGDVDFSEIDESSLDGISDAILKASEYAMDKLGEDSSLLEGENPVMSYLEAAFGADFDYSQIDTSGLTDGMKAVIGSINFQTILAENAGGGADQSGAMGLGLAYVQQMADGMDGSVVSDKTGDVIQTAIAGGESEAGKASVIGSMIAAGIAAGMNGSMAVVVASAKGLVAAAVKAAKQGAQIKSPSRLFADVIGANIAKGVAVGIDENVPDVEKSMSGLINSTALAANIGTSSLSVRQAASDVGVIQQTINFNTEYVTPDVVARTMREYANYGFARG